MLRTCGSTSAEVKEVYSCALTVAVKDVHTYNVGAVLIMFVTMCLLLMSRMYLYRYTSGTKVKGGCVCSYISASEFKDVCDSTSAARV
jgi:hypothetical protein